MQEENPDNNLSGSTNFKYFPCLINVFIRWCYHATLVFNLANWRQFQSEIPCHTRIIKYIMGSGICKHEYFVLFYYLFIFLHRTENFDIYRGTRPIIRGICISGNLPCILTLMKLNSVIWEIELIFYLNERTIDITSLNINTFINVYKNK